MRCLQPGWLQLAELCLGPLVPLPPQINSRKPAAFAHPGPCQQQLQYPTCAGCCRLLDGCSLALQPRTQEALLQLLLSAAQDEWREVADPARTWLAGHAAAGADNEPAAAAGQAGSAFAAALERLLLQLLEGLPAALRSGDLAGRQHAQQLTSAIQASAAWSGFRRKLWVHVTLLHSN